MKNISLQMVKAAIYPAGMLASSKILGIIIANKLFGYTLYITNNSGRCFSVQFRYDTILQVENVSTLSNALMLFTIFIGVFYYLIKAYFFHDTHQSPKLIVKLTSINLLDIFSDTMTIFVNLFVWILYIWIVTGLITYSYLNGTNSVHILIVSIAISLIASFLALWDVQREIDENNLSKRYNEKRL